MQIAESWLVRVATFVVMTRQGSVLADLQTRSPSYASREELELVKAYNRSNDFASITKD